MISIISSISTGDFAICKRSRCTWPQDNLDNLIPTPTAVTCDPAADSVDACGDVIEGGVCTNSTGGNNQYVCGCISGYQRLYGHCVPVIYCKF